MIKQRWRFTKKKYVCVGLVFGPVCTNFIPVSGILCDKCFDIFLGGEE